MMKWMGSYWKRIQFTSWNLPQELENMNDLSQKRVVTLKPVIGSSAKAHKKPFGRFETGYRGFFTCFGPEARALITVQHASLSDGMTTVSCFC